MQRRVWLVRIGRRSLEKERGMCVAMWMPLGHCNNVHGDAAVHAMCIGVWVRRAQIQDNIGVFMSENRASMAENGVRALGVRHTRSSPCRLWDPIVFPGGQ